MVLFRPNVSVKSIALLHDGDGSWFKKGEEAVTLTHTITEDMGRYSVSREWACTFRGCTDIQDQWRQWKKGEFPRIQQDSLQAPCRRPQQKEPRRQANNSCFPHILSLACTQSPCFSPWVVPLGVPIGFKFQIQRKVSIRQQPWFLLLF